MSDQEPCPKWYAIKGSRRKVSFLQWTHFNQQNFHNKNVAITLPERHMLSQIGEYGGTHTWRESYEFECPFVRASIFKITAFFSGLAH